MLWNIVQAFGGSLPGWVQVLFQNTGKERTETLDFVQEVSDRWGVPITWLEYCRDTSKPSWVKGRNGQPSVGQHGWRVVDYRTASRAGEPFDDLLATLAAYREDAKGAEPLLPNPVQRFCTAELKIRTMSRYLLHLGWDLEETTAAVGLRADEPKRVARQAAKLRYKREPLEPRWAISPLALAGVTEPEVMEFWARQPFDLQLQQHEGNCDLCFLKSTSKIKRILSDKPELADWWIAKEEETGKAFRKDRPNVAELRRIALDQVPGPGWLWNESDGDCGELVECNCTD